MYPYPFIAGKYLTLYGIMIAIGIVFTCIIAGIVGAMLISSSKLSDDEIINIATSIEGHPDNVVPAYYGSLNSSVMDESNVYHTRYDVDSELIFNVLIPPFEIDEVRELFKNYPGLVLVDDPKNHIYPLN